MMIITSVRLHPVTTLIPWAATGSMANSAQSSDSQQAKASKEDVQVGPTILTASSLATLGCCNAPMLVREFLTSCSATNHELILDNGSTRTSGFSLTLSLESQSSSIAFVSQPTDTDRQRSQFVPEATNSDAGIVTSSGRFSSNERGSWTEVSTTDFQLAGNATPVLSKPVDVGARLIDDAFIYADNLGCVPQHHFEPDAGLRCALVPAESAASSARTCRANAASCT